MPKFIVKQPINVVRDGKLHAPEIGKPFDFTAGEVGDIQELNPAAIEAIPTAVAPAEAVTKAK